MSLQNSFLAPFTVTVFSFILISFPISDIEKCDTIDETPLRTHEYHKFECIFPRNMFLIFSLACIDDGGQKKKKECQWALNNDFTRFALITVVMDLLLCYISFVRPLLSHSSSSSIPTLMAMTTSFFCHNRVLLILRLPSIWRARPQLTKLSQHSFLPSR